MPLTYPKQTMPMKRRLFPSTLFTRTDLKMEMGQLIPKQISMMPSKGLITFTFPGWIPVPDRSGCAAVIPGREPDKIMSSGFAYLFIAVNGQAASAACSPVLSGTPPARRKPFPQ